MNIWRRYALIAAKLDGFARRLDSSETKLTAHGHLSIFSMTSGPVVDPGPAFEYNATRRRKVVRSAWGIHRIPSGSPCETAQRRFSGETLVCFVDARPGGDLRPHADRRAWGRPRRRRHTRRRAHGTGTRTCRASGRSSTRPRGTSRTMARASACPPGTAWWKAGPSRISRRRSRRRSRTSNSAPRSIRKPGVICLEFPASPTCRIRFRSFSRPTRSRSLYEYVRAIRYIYMNGNPHPPGPIDWWMGDSRGRWEGNTLVVDVVHFHDRNWFDRAGNFHSDAAARRRTLHPHEPQSLAL